MALVCCYAFIYFFFFLLLLSIPFHTLKKKKKSDIDNRQNGPYQLCFFNRDNAEGTNSSKKLFDVCIYFLKFASGLNLWFWDYLWFDDLCAERRNPLWLTGLKIPTNAILKSQKTERTPAFSLSRFESVNASRLMLTSVYHTGSLNSKHPSTMEL